MSKKKLWSPDTIAAERLETLEKAAMADKDRILEEKFREAMKRAEEEPDLPPKRPFDMD